MERGTPLARMEGQAGNPESRVEEGVGTVIFRVSYEEVTVLNSAAQRLLAPAGDVAVAAPPEALAELESRMPVQGDLTVGTLAETRRLLAAVEGYAVAGGSVKRPPSRCTARFGSASLSRLYLASVHVKSLPS